MNIQQMLQNTKKLQREYEKAHKVLEEKLFTEEQNGIVRVSMRGNFTLESIEILDDSVLNKDDKDMISEAIVLCYQKIKEKIDKEDEEIYKKFQQMPGGYMF